MVNLQAGWSKTICSLPQCTCLETSCHFPEWSSFGEIVLPTLFFLMICSLCCHFWSFWNHFNLSFSSSCCTKAIQGALPSAESPGTRPRQWKKQVSSSQLTADSADSTWIHCKDPGNFHQNRWIPDQMSCKICTWLFLFSTCSTTTSSCQCSPSHPMQSALDLQVVALNLRG